MADSLSVADIIDLGKTTLAHLGRQKFNQIAQRITRLEIMSRMLKEDKIEYQDGKEIQFNLMMNHNNSARQVGLHARYNRDIKDVMENGNVPWRHTSWYWGWERRELLMNRNSSRIVRLMNTRRIAALIAAAEHLETQAWGSPTDSSDEETVMGIPFWVQKGSVAAPGFNGTDPSGFSSGRANLSSSTYTRWKNFTGQYVAVTPDDLIDKMIQSARKTDFQSPVDINDYATGRGQTNRIYMNEPTIRKYEVLARLQNDDLGNDLAKYHDDTAFKRSPVKYCPKLDSDSQNPVYMLDFNYIGPVCLAGDTIYEHDPVNGEDQPNSFWVDCDLTFNFCCTDLRRQTVLHVA